eukprot:CAMPEP_0196662576 /NCGR_PEP_ID=MMETSP1086-20130531/49320_1 /TAXON_ID=77921 /ORGANISM="Cyanoptyche  gloeocystis , Strain SAG4.97" /LENGTH=178 /DNA_ID=CAMNT_0041998037 /DNA_START=75 /DNA_END=611 /DNA_ORIENTATION=+
MSRTEEPGASPAAAPGRHHNAPEPLPERENCRRAPETCPPDGCSLSCATPPSPAPPHLQHAATKPPAFSLAACALLLFACLSAVAQVVQALQRCSTRPCVASLPVLLWTASQCTTTRNESLWLRMSRPTGVEWRYWAPAVLPASNHVYNVASLRMSTTPFLHPGANRAPQHDTVRSLC